VLDWAANGTQIEPLQQPPGQEAPLQTHWPVLLLHFCPAAQPAQTAPPAPHAASDWSAYLMHVEPLQQPSGHDVASQTHCPALHLCPGAHAAHFAPPVPQELLV
jgi:hypothetical protein